MNLRGGTAYEADVCIVGGGPAGLTLARQLAESGRSVLVLERGRRHAGGRENTDNARLNSVGVPVGAAVAVRRLALGGSGRVWGQTLAELSADDFAPDPGSPGWPFDLDRLRPYYDRARILLEAEPNEAGATAVSDDLTVVPSWRSPVSFPLPAPLPEGVQTRLAARVVRLVGERGAVRRVEAISQDRPFTAFTVQAGTYVLAAGAIENAMILLQSGLGGDLAGRYFADHPQILIPIGLTRSQLAGVVPSSLFHPPRAAWALTEPGRGTGTPGAAGYLITHRDPALWTKPNVVASGHLVHALLHRDLPARPIPGLGRMVAAFPDLIRAARSRRGDPQQALRVTVESMPDPDSRVTLSPTAHSMGFPTPVVDWRVGVESRLAAERLVAAVGRIADRDGWGPITPPADLGWNELITPGAHHMGTTRMADDPALGVVDAGCRVHGTSNLYAAGASVFPTYGWANPMLTVIALTLRLGDHLGRD